MQTIKNFLNPGQNQDDEILYGERENLAGENFGDSGDRSTSSTAPGTSTSGAGSTGIADASKINRASAGNQVDDTRSRAGIISPNDPTTTRDSTTSNTTGPHSSKIANRADPTVDSHHDTSRHATGTGLGASSVGNTSTSSTSHQNPYSSKQVDSRLGGLNSQATPFETSTADHTTGSGYSNPTNIEGPTRVSGGNTSNLANLTNTRDTSHSGHHLGRDAAAVGTGGAIGEGVHRHRENERSLAGNSSTDYAAGNTSSTSGKHSSNLANKADPTVDSDRDGSRTLGSNSNATAIHHNSRVNERGLDSNIEHDRVGNTAANYGTTSTRPLSGDGHSITRSTGLTGSSGRSVNAGLGSTNTGHHTHDHSHEHSHSHGTEAAATAAAAAATVGSHHNTNNPSPSGVGYAEREVGPHGTGTANRLDPNLAVNSNKPPIADASQHHPETGGGAESADLAHKDTSKLTGSERAIGKEQYAAGSGSGVGVGSTGREYHSGRNAAGVGAVGAAGYEANKLHGRHEGTSGLLGTSGVPGTSSDKAVAGTSGLTGTTGMTRTTGISGTTGTTGTTSTSSTGTAGTTGTSELTGKTGTTGSAGTTGRDHNYGKDAGVVGAVGAGGYAADKHIKSHESGTSTTSSGSQGHAPHSSKILNVLDPRVKTTGIGATKEAKEAEAMRVKSNESGSGIGKDRHDSSATRTSTSTSKDYHYGKDTAGVGAASTGAYEANKLHNKGTRESVISDSTATSGMGRHSALKGASSVGEHERTHGTDSESEKNQHLGDKLHGVERNRGVPESDVMGGSSPSNTTGTNNKYTGFTGTATGFDEPSPTSTGSHTGTGSTGYGTERQHELGSSQTSGTHNTHDRNRLHKDPPASHASSGLASSGKKTDDLYDESSSGNYGAANGASSYGAPKATPRSLAHDSEGTKGVNDHVVSGGVPGGKEARRELVQQGERNLDGKTGVSNSGEGFEKRF